MSAGTPLVRDWLSFERIVDVPFGTCVAAVESWRLTGQDGGHRTGRGLLCGPIEHDRDYGTSLELIPCRYIRPSAAYFRAGHFLLDSLVLSLAQYLPTQRLDRVTLSQLPAGQGQP